MQTTTAISRLNRIASLTVVAILVLLPFHAVFTTWAGSNFGYIDVFRVWKELLMLPLGLYAAWLLVKNKPLLAQFNRSWLVWLIVGYTFLFLLFGIFTFHNNRVNAPALLFSLITNLRFVWFFLIVWIITAADPLVRRFWAQIVLAPAAMVAVFGVLQRFVLPTGFLSHFGYGPDTIPAVQTIDNKADYPRIQSTLRGANPLGAYLVLVVTTLIAKLRARWYTPLLLALSLVAMFLSYSRSAWIGLVTALGVLAWMQLGRVKNQQVVLVGLALALLVGVGTVVLFRDNDVLQNTLFHSDESSTSIQSSNAARTSYLQQGVKDIINEPLGRGPGTAGPASVRNNQQTRIAENYYLQIGQEVGIAGLLLFVGIAGLTAKALWCRRQHALAQVLFASLAGLAVINLMSHAWTDDTISLLWWGLAGAAMTLPVIMKSEHKQHEKKTRTR